MPSSGSGTGTPVSGNNYCTLAEFKADKNITTTDATRDARITEDIEAASRWIDAQCWRRFYAATETRYYAPQSTHEIFIDDLLSLTTLKTDEDGDGTFEITWDASDYQLEPRNALYAFPPEPYTMIRAKVQGDYSFPVLRIGDVLQESIEIVGSWGYSASTPDAINKACLLKVAQLFNATHGIGAKGGGNQTTGQAQSPSDKRIDDLLAPFKRLI